MLEISIPGYKTLALEHIVLDYNGTMATDGLLIDGVKPRLDELSTQMEIHVLTADTFGQVRAGIAGTAWKLAVLATAGQELAKLEYIKKLGPEKTVSIGNGRNDRRMLKEAALGIAVLQEEGAAIETLLTADVVTQNITAALDLLIKPLRLVATLRS